MQDSLFGVDEVCILQSVDHPQHNGIEVVVTSKTYREHGYNYVDEKDLGEGWYYSISPNPIGSGDWAQRALRKRHTPSGESFNELMDELTDNLTA